MKVLIFGADGMLGTDLVRVLKQQHQVVESLEKDLDITDNDKVKGLISSLGPDLVINAAAYTDVDGCEEYKEKAFAVNANGPKNLARSCSNNNIRMIHFSTDYVFDGNKESPYTEEDDTNPINVYGASKLEGETNIRTYLEDHVIIRTQWLYGRNGKNFVNTMLKLFEKRSELKVVSDQYGSPTYTLDLANAVRVMTDEDVPAGIYNVCNNGYCSWFEFTCDIADKVENRGISIIPVTTKEFTRPAKRPMNSRLDQSKFNKTVGHQVRNWKEALKSFLRSR